MDDLTLGETATIEIGDMLEQGFAMAQVRMSLYDGTLDAFLGIDMEIPVVYTGAETIDEVRRRVYERALIAVRAAARLLGELDPPAVAKSPPAPPASPGP